jgi:hypothetical protein
MAAIQPGCLRRFHKALKGASGSDGDRFKAVPTEQATGDDWIIADFGDLTVTSNHINASRMSHPDDDAEFFVVARNEAWDILRLIDACWDALEAIPATGDVSQPGWWETRDALDLLELATKGAEDEEEAE